jgi:WD repeat-containing protein 76
MASPDHEAEHSSPASSAPASPASKAKLSDYQLKRQENIARKNELLLRLKNEAQLSGLVPSPKPAATSRKTKKRAADEPLLPVRTSARLRGVKAEGDTPKAEKTLQQAPERIAGKFTIAEIVQAKYDGTLKLDSHGNVGIHLPFDPTTAKETSDAELRTAIDEFAGLRLWANVDPTRTCYPSRSALLTVSDIKITPDRAV